MYEIIYKDIQENEKYEKIIKEVITQCYKEEKMQNTMLIVSITLTTPDNIQKINKQYREIDKATDVLSFPMYEKEEIEQVIKNNNKEDILGDIVISIEKVKEQAKEYGHSFERELSYMVVHGFYHLMGFDHIEEQDKQKMRLKEEKILEDLNLEKK